MTVLLGGKDKLQKIYRGCYDYYRGKDTYCEENFEVFFHHKDLYYRFVSKSMGRVQTGEMLTVTVKYEMTDKFVPRNASIEKVLGNQLSNETYEFDQKTNILHYHFKGNDGEGDVMLATNHKFHITLPSAATSLLFMKTKKFNNTSKNNYTIVGTNNQWKFEKGPEFKGVSLERIGANKDNITIGKSRLQAFKYKVSPESLDAASNMMKGKSEKKPFIVTHISNHLTIPYKIVTTIENQKEKNDENTSILIRFLNDLREE